MTDRSNKKDKNRNRQTLREFVETDVRKALGRSDGVDAATENKTQKNGFSSIENASANIVRYTIPLVDEAEAVGSAPEPGDATARLQKIRQAVHLPADSSRTTPLIEVEIVHEHGPSPTAPPINRTLNIYTVNHVYVMDANMICIEVYNPATGEAVPDHVFLGAQLVGGHRQGERGFELSYPLPLPGNLAVFEGRKGKQKQFSSTSLVMRVVICLHLVTVPANRVLPTWTTITDPSRP